jgi:hypothetical protein
MFNRKSKRRYRKPVLDSRRLELGVFGEYGDDGGGGGGGDDPPIPGPIKIIRHAKLHME